jgi:hypothetical protein
VVNLNGAKGLGEACFSFHFMCLQEVVDHRVKSMVQSREASRPDHATARSPALPRLPVIWPQEPRRLGVRSLIGLALGFVGCAMLYVIFVYAVGEETAGALLIDGEGGILEIMQEAILFVAIVMAAWLAWRAGPGGLRKWLVLVTLGLVLLYGEEISWGQHLAGWDTHGWFAAHNTQGETNIHNTSWLLNTLPRRILTIAIGLAGGIYPLARRFMKRDPRGIEPWLPPRLWGVMPALFACFTVAVRLSSALTFWTFGTDNFELSEVEELYFYLFFVTYLYGIAVLLRKARAAQSLQEDAAASLT